MILAGAATTLMRRILRKTILTRLPEILPCKPSIFGKLPVVPIGDTGTIPFAMRQNARDCVDAAFDTSEGSESGDGSRWWYINTLALSWSLERLEK